MAHIIKMDGTAVKASPKDGKHFNNIEIASLLSCENVSVLPLIATDKETGRYEKLQLAYNSEADEKGNKLKTNPNSIRLTGSEIGGDMLLMHEVEYCEA